MGKGKTGMGTRGGNSWFRDANGALIDPRSANKGGANENLVKSNIRTSIEGFEDDDRDGVED